MKRATQHIAAGGIGRVVAVVGMWLRIKPDEYFKDLWKLGRLLDSPFEPAKK